MLLSACLSSNYTVSKDELIRLSRLPPEGRSSSVRVTQRFSTSESPRSAYSTPSMAPSVGFGSGYYGGGGFYGGYGYYGGSGSYGGSGYPGYQGRRYYEGPRSRSGQPYRPTQRYAPPTTTGPSSSTRPRKSKNDDDAAIALIIIGATVAITLAATEGARFDGYAQLPPNQPLHLYRNGTEEGWVPLAELRPDIAQFVDHAVVSEAEGPVYRLSRAPLDRVGLAFDFEFGAGTLSTFERNRSPLGFASRIALGGFPHQQLGIFAGLGIGAGHLPDGDTHGQYRPFLELQAFAPRLGVLNLGGYGEVGYLFGSQYDQNGIDRSLGTWFAGAGALVQFELTTRLALTLRGGATLIPGPGSTMISPQILAGLTIF